MCYEVKLPWILSGIRSRLRFGGPELYNYDDNWQLQLTSELYPSNRYSLRSCMRLGASEATSFNCGEWPYQNRKQPLLQTITKPEVQECSTLRYTHQMRRRAAASTPIDESTSGLRGWQYVHRVNWWQAHQQIMQQPHSEESQRAHPAIWDNVIT
jgi:hypothetical protein